MRAMGLVAAILTLGSCGVSSHTEVRYRVKAATNCIRLAYPAESSSSTPEEYPGGFGIAVGDDHYS